ncbi:unnamed protein product, partial [Mesorhabditis spiculigera]
MVQLARSSQQKTPAKRTSRHLAERNGEPVNTIDKYFASQKTSPEDMTFRRRRPPSHATRGENFPNSTGLSPPPSPEFVSDWIEMQKRKKMRQSQVDSVITLSDTTPSPTVETSLRKKRCTAFRQRSSAAKRSSGCETPTSRRPRLSNASNNSPAALHNEPDVQKLVVTQAKSPSMTPAERLRNGEKREKDTTTPVSRVARGTKRKLPASAKDPTPEKDSTPELSRKKTRKTHQLDAEAEKLCTMCQNEDDELMANCSNCHRYYHLSSCLRYPALTAMRLGKRDDWMCPQCILCAQCSKLIDDSGNKECPECGRAWHGSCSSHANFSDTGICRLCTPNSSKKKGPKEAKFNAPRQPPASPEIRWNAGGGSNTRKDFQDVVNSRLSKPFSAIPRKEMIKCEMTETKTKKARTSGTLGVASTSSSWALDLTAEEANKHAMGLFSKAKTGPRSGASTNRANRVSGEAWITVGNRPRMRAEYPASLPGFLVGAADISVCPHCLNWGIGLDQLNIHRELCSFPHPPGVEIYRDDDVSFYEVDGAAQSLYCRQLCNLSMLYLHSKLLQNDVGNFWFYVLTEHTPTGDEIVGYFSKEKKPCKSYNLSCLLVLPYAQKKGYGSLLIDLSYELSRREHKVGGPERPLSNLGLQTYSRYWRASILRYIRSRASHGEISIHDMVIQTRIQQENIVEQLLRDRLLYQRDNVYYIRYADALRMPLSDLRWRRLDRALLLWTNDSHGDALDPDKINSYIAETPKRN